MRRTRNKFYADLGFRIRQIRSLNHMTQQELGERIGVTKQTVYRYETGEIPISPEALARCAAALKTPVGFFYGEDGQQPARSGVNKTGLMVAAEIMDLPDDTIRKGVFHLVRSINRYEETRQKEE